MSLYYTASSNHATSVEARADVFSRDALALALGNLTNGTSQTPTRKLASSLPFLDDLLEGGPSFGSLSEWGVPMGQGGREVVLQFLANATQGYQQSPLWALWIYHRPELNICPAAWQARGVDLARLRLARSAQPVADLKALFMDPFFQFIVLDAPERLSMEDCAFIARQARMHNKIVILLRDYFLSSERGNVWAKLRVNCWLDPTSNKICVRLIRGLSPRQLAFYMPTL